jgi:hypothetical protein
MELTQSSGTLAFNTQTPGKYPEDNYSLLQHGESLKSRKNITVYVSGYTETDTTGILSPTSVWPFSVAVDINSNVFDFYCLIWRSLSRLMCCVDSGSNVAAALVPLLPPPSSTQYPSYVRTLVGSRNWSGHGDEAVVVNV